MRKSILFFILVLTCLFGLFLTCCDDCEDCPICPDPEPVEEHIFYISHSFGDSVIVKAFSADKYKFVDSFSIDIDDTWDMDIIGEYEKLIVTDNQELKIINLESRAIETESVEYGRSVLVSDNSKYYKAFKLDLTNMTIFNSESYLPVYTDSIRMGTGHFIKGTNKYIGEYDTGNVFVCDIANDIIDTSYNVKYNDYDVSIYRLQYIPEFEKIYVIGGYAYTPFLGVMEYGSDSLTILRSPLKTGGDDFAVSSDGKYLYYINAPYFDYENPSYKVEVFDVSNDQVVAEILTEDYDSFEPYEMVISSDGKYLLVLPLSWTSIDFILIDAVNFSIIGKYKFSDQQWDLRAVCTKH